MSKSLASNSIKEKKTSKNAFNTIMEETELFFFFFRKIIGFPVANAFNISLIGLTFTTLALSNPRAT